MESSPSNEVMHVSDTLDSWNRERTVSELVSFVQRRYQAVSDLDELAI